MRAFCALYLEGFRWLRRDKIFLPILFAGLGVAIFASTVSQWSLEDMKKILFAPFGMLTNAQATVIFLKIPKKER